MAERYEQGKHLSLLNDDYLLQHSNIPRHIIPAYSGWFELTSELDGREESDPINQKYLEIAQGMAKKIEEYLDTTLELTPSIGGRGRRETIDAIGAQTDNKQHRESGNNYAMIERPSEAPRKKGLGGGRL